MAAETDVPWQHLVDLVRQCVSMSGLLRDRQGDAEQKARRKRWTSILHDELAGAKPLTWLCSTELLPALHLKSFYRSLQVEDDPSAC
jgi:hypothetical protein